MGKQPAVYIMANKRNGTLSTGVTANLTARVWQHKEGIADGFTEQYDLRALVDAEQHKDMASAIEREKQIKEWKRRWKLALIEQHNPKWRDLYEDFI